VDALPGVQCIPRADTSPCFFSVELWNLSNIGFLLLKVLASALTSMLFIIVYLLIVYKAECIKDIGLVEWEDIIEINTITANRNIWFDPVDI